MLHSSRGREVRWCCDWAVTVLGFLVGRREKHAGDDDDDSYTGGHGIVTAGNLQGGSVEWH